MASVSRLWWGIAPLSIALAACSAAPPPETSTSGVEGRSAEEVCKSNSPACQEWTALAHKCAENERRREEGYMGKLEPYCTQMEEYRERVTGIPDSSSPGAYDF